MYLWINKLEIKLGDISCPIILSHTHCWCFFASQQLAAPPFFTLESLFDSWEKVMISTLLWTSRFLFVYPPVFPLKKQFIWTFSKSLKQQPVLFFFFFLRFTIQIGIFLLPKTTFILGLPMWHSSKESACNAGDPASITGSRRSPEKGMTIHSSILAWRILWVEEPDSYSPWGHQESDTWLTLLLLHLF